jgi:hypothetical protein
MADQEITIKISAKNLTSEEFAKARKEVAGLTDASNKGSKEAASGWKDFGSSLKDVGTAAFQAGSIVTASLAAMVAGVAALGARGADINDVRAQFDVLNKSIGVDSKAAIDVLDQGLAGTIPKFELMKTVNAGLSQGMKASIEDYRTMAEVSRVLADRTGIDNKQAFETLTSTMASGKDMVLKTIGMNIDAKAATDDYARSIGKATADLNENEIKTAKRNAIMVEANRILKESGKSQDDFADSLSKVSATFQNWLDDLSVGIADSPVLGAALASVGDILKEVFGGSNAELIPTIIHYIEQAAITMVEWGKTGVTIADYISRAFSGLQVVFDAMGTAVFRVASWFLKLEEATATAASYIPGLGKEYGAAAKQAHEMATQLGGMADGFSDAGGAALQSAIGTRDSNDLLVRLDKTLTGVRDKMVNATGATNEHTSSMKGHTAAVVADNGVSAAQQKLLDDYAAKLRTLVAGLEMAGKNGLGAKAIADQYGKAITEVLTIAGALGQKVPEIVVDAFKKANFASLNEQMAKEWDRIIAEGQAKADAGQKVRNASFVSNLQATISAERSAMDIHNKRSMTDLEFQQTIIKREAQDKKDALDQFGANYKEAMDAIDQETDQKMHQAAVDYMDALDQMKDHTKDWSVMVNKWIGGIPDLLQKAFTGGGGLGGAAKALSSGIGGDAVGKMFGGGDDGKFFGVSLSSVTNKLGGMFGKTIGGALGVALPGIGSALGALAGPLIGKVGGFFKSIFGTAGRDAVRGFADSFGGFDALHKQLDAMGTSGEQMWVKLTQGVGRGNAQQAKEAIDAVTKALGDYETKLNDARTAEEGVADRMGHITEITPELQAALDKAYDAKNPEDYTAALKGVGDVMDSQDAKQKQLDATLQKYGLSWTDLGASARAAKLGDIASGLITDFMTLKDAGVDVNHIMEKMKPTLQDFVNQAKKTGTEVPESMKPVLQSAIDAGVLFDENGKKITDMTGTGLTFGQTMTQNFKDVSSAIEHLAQVLEGQIVGGFQSAADRAKGAINSIPTSRDFSVNGVYNAPDVPSGDGSDLEGHAKGGLFSTPHIARIAEAGQPEIIGTEQFMARAIAGAQAMLPGGGALGGGSTQVVFQLHTPLATIDTVRQAVFDEFGPALLSWLEGNHSGSRTKMNQILAMGNV